MGLTFLAAGTSVPEAVSSVIVTAQGHGSMGLSNSIGSNIFDILLCLGLPWLIKTLIVPTIKGQPWVSRNNRLKLLSYAKLSRLRSTNQASRTRQSRCSPRSSHFTSHSPSTGSSSIGKSAFTACCFISSFWSFHRSWNWMFSFPSPHERAITDDSIRWCKLLWERVAIMLWNNCDPSPITLI